MINIHEFVHVMKQKSSQSKISESFSFLVAGVRNTQCLRYPSLSLMVEES